MLHGNINPPKGFAAYQDFVRGEYDTQLLLLVAAGEFGQDELIERQRQIMSRCKLNAKSARLRINGPTFG